MRLVKDILKAIIYLFGALIGVVLVIALFFYIMLTMNHTKGVSLVDIEMIVKFMLPIPLVAMGLLGLIRLFEKK